MRRLIVVAAIVFLVIKVGQRVVNLEASDMRMYLFCGASSTEWVSGSGGRCIDLGIVLLRDVPGCGFLIGINLPPEIADQQIRQAQEPQYRSAQQEMVMDCQ